VIKRVAKELGIKLVPGKQGRSKEHTRTREGVYPAGIAQRVDDARMRRLAEQKRQLAMVRQRIAMKKGVA
jgi:hypothetical protein